MFMPLKRLVEYFNDRLVREYRSSFRPMKVLAFLVKRYDLTIDELKVFFEGLAVYLDSKALV
jgi:hypothetical protein